MKFALISGTSIAHSSLFSSWQVLAVETPHGSVEFRAKGGWVVLNRHGWGEPVPPHSINAKANIAALAKLGHTQILALSSVGSLKPEIAPGTFLSCSDYVCLQTPPATFHDRELKGGRPGISNSLLPVLLRGLAPEFTLSTGLVYVQMRGPRFETKAEIEVIRHWGDVVGMTAAYEADLCAEAGLSYTSLAIVDNYANGIAGSEVSFANFPDLVQRNQEAVNRLLARLLEIFPTSP